MKIINEILYSIGFRHPKHCKMFGHIERCYMGFDNRCNRCGLFGKDLLKSEEKQK